MMYYDDPRLAEYWSLKPEEQRKLYESLVASPDRWFLHATGFKILEKIRAEGILKPCWPQNTNPGSPYRELLCLTPSDAKRHPGTTKYPPIRVALAAHDLTADIGLDWSYAPKELIDKLDTSETKTDRMMRHILDLGCVVSFEQISSKLLRVQTSESMDPSSWPLLHASHPRDWWWDKQMMVPTDEAEFVYVEK